MKLTAIVEEGTAAPPWYRVWRAPEAWDRQWNVAVIPLCWILRLAWNIWQLTYFMRPNRLERLIRIAYDEGYRKGVAVGRMQSRGGWGFYRPSPPEGYRGG